MNAEHQMVASDVFITWVNDEGILLMATAVTTPRTGAELALRSARVLAFTIACKARIP